MLVKRLTLVPVGKQPSFYSCEEEFVPNDLRRILCRVPCIQPFTFSEYEQ